MSSGFLGTSGIYPRLAVPRDDHRSECPMHRLPLGPSVRQRSRRPPLTRPPLGLCSGGS